MNTESSTTYLYIDTQPALESMIEKLGKADRVGVDTEADSFHHYYEKLCLLQLSFKGKNYVVDPLAGLDLSGLMKALQDKRLVVHAGDFDLRMLLTTYDFRPKGTVFDTMLAAQILGLKQVGLAALVELYFKVSMSKQGQKADWSCRPLTTALLEYASDDTRYLEPLAEKMERELEKKGRLGWHQETCERLAKTISKRKPRDPEDAWRIKGSSQLKSRRQLAFLFELWKWREQEAQRADRPPFKVLGNQQLLDLAVYAAADPQKAPEGFVSLPRHCTGRRLAALKAACEGAEALPEDQWPHPKKGTRPEPAEDISVTVDELRSRIAKLAGGLDMDASVVAPRAVLNILVRQRAKTPEAMIKAAGIMRWQADLIEPLIRDVLEGKKAETGKPANSKARS